MHFIITLIILILLEYGIKLSAENRNIYCPNLIIFLQIKIIQDSDILCMIYERNLPDLLSVIVRVFFICL